MIVFKFGGASVKSAEAIRNVADIIDDYSEQKLMLIISAMDKTTNALENLLNAKIHGDNDFDSQFTKIKDFHFNIIESLFPKNYAIVFEEVDRVFNNLNESINKSHDNFYKSYAEIVSYGEILSSTILHNYLLFRGLKSDLQNAGDYIITENKYINAEVDWDFCPTIINKNLKPLFDKYNVIVSQGFTAKNGAGEITTLGREGSDYSAAIFAYGLNAKEITIWKDVPGLLNADPKYFNDTIKLNKISYKQTIELAYYGASVIHPKTIQPLKKKGIPLRIKSFLNPKEDGTLIHQDAKLETIIPSFILKKNQVLLSVSARDFAFIAEDSLSIIFKKLNEYNLKVNLMQNSAISFSICLDNNKEIIQRFIIDLQTIFKVRYNENMELITIQNYNQKIIDDLIGNRDVFLEQKSRTTAQLLVR